MTTDHGQQHALRRSTSDATAARAGATRAFWGPFGFWSAESREVVRGARRAHQRERPADDDQPQGDGKPHDHTLKVAPGGQSANRVRTPCTVRDPCRLTMRRPLRGRNSFRCLARCGPLEAREHRPTGGSAWAGRTSSRTADPAVTEVRPGLRMKPLGRGGSTNTKTIAPARQRRQSSLSRHHARRYRRTTCPESSTSSRRSSSWRSSRRSTSATSSSPGGDWRSSGIRTSRRPASSSSTSGT